MLKINHVMKLISFWPPYLASGISVNTYNLEESFVKIRLKTSRMNSNLFGTHFGGSLYSMCDPWFVFLVVNKLGRDFIVWDISASIDFIKATKKPVYAEFKIGREQFDEIIEATKDGDTYKPIFTTKVYSDEEIVATVSKTIYIRKKKIQNSN